jgi:hypothetical protein
LLYFLGIIFVKQSHKKKLTDVVVMVTPSNDIPEGNFLKRINSKGIVVEVRNSDTGIFFGFLGQAVTFKEIN